MVPPLGLSERIVAGAQSLWPLAVVVTLLVARPTGIHVPHRFGLAEEPSAVAGAPARGHKQRAGRRWRRSSSAVPRPWSVGRWPARPRCSSSSGAWRGPWAPRPAQGELRGDLQFDLEGPRGTRRAWTVSAGPLRATARRGPSSAPTLVLRTTPDDLLRLVAGRLDAGDALLDGRLDLEGDLALAVRMGDLSRR